MMEWVIKTGLPAISILGGIVGMVLVNYYNAKFGDATLGPFWFLAILACVGLLVMGVTGWLFWRE